MIHIIGDSHVLSFDALPFTHHFIGGKDGGATAYGLGKESSSTNSRNRVLDVCIRLKAGETIILCFGEVDCRIHVYRQWLRTNVYVPETLNWASIDKIIDATVVNYERLIVEVQKIYPRDVFVLSIPPTRAGIGFLDIYSKITDSSGIMLKEYI